MRLKPQVPQLVTAVVMIALSHAVPLNRFDSEGNSLHQERRNETSFDREFSSVCVIDDVLYQTGDPVPPASPCEKCTCQPPTISCFPVHCDFKPNCKALKMSDQCCTVYQCECEHNGRLYQNGERLETPENPCDVCYCRGGEVSCTRIECYKRDDCEPQLVPGRCCPKYDHCPPIDQPRHEKTRPQYVRTEFNRDRTPSVNQVVHQRTGLLDLDNEASEDVTATAIPTESFSEHISSTAILSSVGNTETHSSTADDTENYTNNSEKLPTNIFDDEARFTPEVSESQLTDSHKASSVSKLIPITPEDPEHGMTSTYSSSEEGSGTTSSDENITTSKEGIVGKTSASSSESDLETASGDGEGSGSEKYEQRTESNFLTTLITGKIAQEIHETPEITTDSAESGQTTVSPALRSGLLDTTLTADESTEATEVVDKDLTTEGLFINVRANTSPTSTSQVALTDSIDKISESKEAGSDNTATTERYSETTKIIGDTTSVEFRQKEREPINNSEEGSGDSTTEFKTLEDETTAVILEKLQESNKAVKHTDLDSSETKTESNTDVTNPSTDITLTYDSSEGNARVKIISSSNAVRIFSREKELAADQAPEGTVTESATVSFTNFENGLFALPIAQDLVNNVMDVVLVGTEEPNNEETLTTDGPTTENTPTDAVISRKRVFNKKLEPGTESVMEQTEITTAAKDEVTTVNPSVKLQKSSLLQASDSSTDTTDNLLTTTEVNLQNGISDNVKSSSNLQEEIDLTTLPSELDEITATTQKSESKNVESVTSSEGLTTTQPEIQTSVPHLRIAENSENAQLDDLGTEKTMDSQPSGTEQPKLEKIKLLDEVATTLSSESETTTQQSAQNSAEVFVHLASETSSVNVEPSATTDSDEARTEMFQSTTIALEETTKHALLDEDSLTTIIDFKAGWPQQDTTEKIAPIESHEKELTNQTAALENSDTKSSNSIESTTPDIETTIIPEDVTVLPGISNLKERTAIKLSAEHETEASTEESKNEEQGTSTDTIKQVNEEVTTPIPTELSTIIPETITGEQSEVKVRFAQSEDYKSTIIPQEESTIVPSAVESTTDATQKDSQSTDSLQPTGSRNIVPDQTEYSKVTTEIPTTYKPISVKPRIYEISTSSEEQQSEQEGTTDNSLDTTVSLGSVKNEESPKFFQTVRDQPTTEGVINTPPDFTVKEHLEKNQETPEPFPTEQSSVSIEQDSTESTTSNAQDALPLESIIQKTQEIFSSSSTDQSTDSTEQDSRESTTKQYIEDTPSNIQDGAPQKFTHLEQSKEEKQILPLSSPTEQSIESTEQDSNESTTTLYAEDLSSRVLNVISQEPVNNEQIKEEISESSPTEESITPTDQNSNEPTTEPNIKDTVPLASEIQERTKEIQQEISTFSAVTGEHDEEVEVTTLPRDWLKSDNTSETDGTPEEVKADSTGISTEAVSLTTEEVMTEKSIFGSIPLRNNSTSQNETANTDQTESTSVSDSSTPNEKSDDHVPKVRSIDNFDVNSDNDNSFITPEEGLTHSSHSRYASSYTSNSDQFPTLDDFFTRLFHHRDGEQSAVF